MTEEESVDAFNRVVTMIPENHVVVATGDFSARYALWIKRDYSMVSNPAAAAHQRLRTRSAYVAPSNETERLIAEIWQQMLGMEQVGTQDNFFNLGGHSLLATKLVARLRSAFEVDLPLQKFFEAPTVVGLARELESLKSEKEGAETEDLMNMLANLSDEEVHKELNKRKSSLENQTGEHALPTYNTTARQS